MEEDNDKMSKGFKVTSVCREDILQVIEDQMDERDELRKTMLIKGVENITDKEMGWIASKLADDFCECCFWDNLEYEFKKIMEKKHGVKI